jgi:outer membrane receptor for ferrienterochelin and colicins
MKNYLFIVSLCFHMTVFGQTTFQVRGQETQNSLSGATAAVVSLKSGKSELLIADEEGLFHTSLPLPIEVSLRYLGYIKKKTTIKTNGQVITLEPSVSELEQVVVTGQFKPQSARNTVYQVKSIDRKRIEAQGATSMFDVLANELNVTINRDNATGRSGITMQGLGGQYIKVLMDGVPVTGKGGVANDIDLGQINLEDVERVEIVEGPMAVNYGADALAGVINIITKKAVLKRFEIGITLQEESIGNSYSWFSEGLHTPALSIGANLTDHWYTQVSGRWYQFGGWQGNSTGRTHDWYPKTQQLGSWLTRFEKENFEIYYRLDHTTETLENLGAVNDNNPLLDPFAIDEDYQSTRWSHQLQSTWQMKATALNSVFSYSHYDRRTHQFSKNLITGQETSTIDSEQDTLHYSTFFSRQTLNNAFKGNWGSMQLGLEATHETARGTTLNEGDKTMTDLAFFTSIEFKVNEVFKIRPGLRLSHNSVFRTTPTASINLSYRISEQTQWRGSYGRGFRAPSLRELYHEFIDANHHIVGNANLTPEYSHSVNTDINHELTELPLTLAVSGFYNDISNLITYFSPEGTVNQATSYINLEQFKTVGGQFTASYKLKHVHFNSGLSRIGRYQQLSESSAIPEFVFQTQVNARLTWQIEGLAKTRLAAFYKFNGANASYQLDSEGEPQLRQLDAFHLLDITASNALSADLDVTLGIRNVTNVTTVNNTFSGGAHSGGGQSPMLNGRSYFLQIRYRFNH